MMDEQSKYVSIGKEKLHYLQWGNGGRLLLAFHGYGDDASIFSPFLEHLTKDYTILSFDLPHHGNSKWTDNTKFSQKDLVELVNALSATYKVEKISLLGHSMGSRVCLAILEFMPAAIDKVALIAADGLSINLYYYFLTRTFIGKKLFKKMMEQPGFFFSVVNWLNKKNLVNASRHKFVMNFMHSETGRNLLLQVWPGMSDIIPSPTKLKRLIRQYNIPVSIFMGANDRITPPHLGKNFKSGLDTVQLHILEKGHRVFDHENAAQIAQSLL
jgi:pimeloyl-ACP methyl ester carboxylesterase